MDLEKATILFLLIELEKRKDREATRGTRTGRVEFVQPRRKYWAAKRKGTSFNPISQLEFRIKRSARARNRLATAERNVSFYKPWREIDFDRAAQNWGWERFESKRKSIYRKFFIVLSYSSQCFTNSKNLGKEIGKENEKRSNKRKSKRTKIRDDGRQLRWTLRETTCRGRWFIQTIILAHFTDNRWMDTILVSWRGDARARALDMTLDKFTRTVCTRSLQRPSTSLRNDSTSRRCATLSL